MSHPSEVPNEGLVVKRLPNPGPPRHRDAVRWTPSTLRSLLVAPLACTGHEEREATRQVLIEALAEVDEVTLEGALTPGLAQALMSELGLGGLDTRLVARFGPECVEGLRPIRRLLAREASRQLGHHHSGIVVRSVEGDWCSASVATSELPLPGDDVTVLHIDYERPRANGPVSELVRVACRDAGIVDELVTVKTRLGAVTPVPAESWRFALEVAVRLATEGEGPRQRWALDDGSGDLGSLPPDVRIVVRLDRDHDAPCVVAEAGRKIIAVQSAADAAQALANL